MKIDRLVSMIMLLLEKERIGAQELANLFEVSARTIYRDIDAINLAGIPVRSISGVNGGFEIMKQYKLDKGVFSTADLSAILMGLSSLSGMIRGDELVNAFAKVRSFIPADRAKDIECKANQISIDLSPWMGSRNVQLTLETIKTALQEQKLLSFEYLDRHGNKTARTAEPYQLVLKGNQWYWQGYCYTRNDFRLFKLSRMSNPNMLGASFAPREHPKPQLDISDMLPTLQTKIKLRIHQSILERVLDCCNDEDISPDGDEHNFVNYPFIENDYYYGILLSFGSKCECLEPARVRAEMRRRATAIAALYED
ncbi:MAG: YafY family transcriptional regulator [Clostridiales bacterium]|nr:YafY family transcriptional regulator [Clostridiales bacterium]